MPSSKDGCRCYELGPLSLRSGDICSFCQRELLVREENCTVGAGVPSRVYTRDVAIAAALRAKGATGRCVKCSRVSGDDWEQCNRDCPMPISPHYNELTSRAFEVLPLAKQDEYGRAETRLHEEV